LLQKDAAPYAVEEVPLTQVVADLAAKKTTSVAVTKAYIARIKEYDAPLHSVILIAPDAEQQAAAADKRRADGKTLGPLDGVPILIKDNIDATGMPTTAGSYVLENNTPAKDSEVARRLRAAGAVILGKTNLSQWAGWRDIASFNGSTVGKDPHNPYDLTRTPAGSSSGSGIATATSFAAATIGTETSGSITGPSTINGVVGLKPTIALISRRGIVPHRPYPGYLRPDGA
jgi:amidase